MERIVVNYNNGNVKEFIDPSGQIISGDSLIITTKKMIDGDDNSDYHIITTSEVISLKDIKNFLKITPTRKLNIEENVSEK